VEKGSFGDMMDMGFKCECGVKNVTKISDLGKGGNCMAIDGESEVLGGGED